MARFAYAAGALALALLAAVAFLRYRADTVEPPKTLPASAPASPAVLQSSTTLRLDRSDAEVRARAAAIAPHALWGRLLEGDYLVRRLAAAVAMVADGETPAPALEALAPAEPFRAIKKGGALYLDPRSYARYDDAVRMFASIDAARAAALFRELEPLFAQACAELDSRRCDPRRAVPAALAQLLATPASAGPVRLKPKALRYEFADPALERLSPAQKQLLRLGPANRKLVERQLRAFAAALGIQASELPPEPKP